MIRFSCPTCGTHFNAPPSRIGEKFDCTRCGQRIEVPGPASKTVLGKIEAAPQPPPLPRDRPARSKREDSVDRPQRPRRQSSAWVIWLVLGLVGVGVVFPALICAGMMSQSPATQAPNAHCPNCHHEWRIPVHNAHQAVLADYTCPNCWNQFPAMALYIRR
jgi:DNA-directed RNA polymerase subunit RPC12/RpoP